MISTRLTQQLGLLHPVISAPMAFASGGQLAAAVSAGGGLGLIGGGYGDAHWLEAEFTAAKNQPVGCGLITWSLAQQPELLDQVLRHSPKALFLSFGDPAAFVPQIKKAGVTLICQVQSLRDAKHAIDVGADIIVAQGAEAGGHGDSRATLTLVPEVANYIAAQAPAVLLCAAGGIADGRGLAAALMLGADGVVMGSRFLASPEALIHENAKNALMVTDGDATLQTSVTDIVRDRDWDERYRIRVLKNRFTDQWHGREAALRNDAAQAGKWAEALAAGDTEHSSVVVGEAVGLMADIFPAGEILNETVTQAAKLLRGAGEFLGR